MISSQIPHNAIYLPVSLIFTAQFNNPAIGRYSFNTAANRGRELLKFQPNTWYFLDAMSVGGTISEPEYCQSIYEIPTLVLKKSITGERVYTRALTIPKYSENRELTVFTNSKKGSPRIPGGIQNEDTLVADLEGILNQIPATVGQATISLNFAISIFQVDEKEYNRAMLDTTAPSYGQKMRK